MFGYLFVLLYFQLDLSISFNSITNYIENMEKPTLLFFVGVFSAFLVTIILATENEPSFSNFESFVLGLAEAITKIWMIFFAFSLLIVFPILGIDSIKKRIKPIFLLPISFTLGHGTVIVLLSAIKFSIDVMM